MKKGQAALEFLMTYGWAILVVLAAIGALAYFGVFNPTKFVNPKCVTSPGMECPGAPVFTANSFAFTIENHVGAPITVTPANIQAMSLPASSKLSCGAVNTNKYICPKGTATPGVTCVNFAGGPGQLVIADGDAATVHFGNAANPCLYNGVAFVKGSLMSSDLTLTYTNPASGLSETRDFTVQGRY